MHPEGEDARPVRRAADGRAARHARLFEEALRTGDAPTAGTAAEGAIGDGLSAAAVQSRVITPAMRHIGDLWQADTITVADEHLATAVSEGVLAKLFPSLLVAPPSSREEIVLAAVQGEHHTMGLRMVADVLEGAGFEVAYLGADVPTESLVEVCSRRRPAIVGLTAAMPLNVPTLIAAIAAIAELPDPPRFLVGGRGLALAMRAGLNVRFVSATDDLVAVVDEVLSAPPGPPAVSADLIERLPGGAALAPGGTEEIRTIADAFAQTAASAADASRTSARHAFDMEQLAYRDGLTGLWNRRAYDDKLQELEGESGDPETRVLMLDVDNFKSINDGWGHEAGDQALVRVGRSILASIRPSDFAARFGGDEFVVVLPDAGSAAAIAIAERIRAAVDQQTEEPAMTVSIGLAVFNGDGRGTGLAVDQALYDAKRAGRNQVVREGAA